MKRNLLLDVVLLSFTRLIIIIASLLQGMILARALTKGEYAIYAQVLIPLNIVTNLFSLALPNSINYFATRTRNSIQQIDFISKILTLIISLSLIGAFILLFGRDIISRNINVEIYSVLSIAFILPVFRLVSKAYDNIFVISNKTRKVANRKTFMAICQILTAFYVWYFDKSVLFLFIVIVSYELIMFIYMIITINKDIGKIRPKFFSSTELKKVLLFCTPLAVASFVGTLNIEVGKIFVNHYFGNEKFAEYAVVAKELPINIIAAAVSAVLVPQISKYLSQNHLKKVTELWKNSVELSFISTSWMIGFLIVCATECVLFLFSNKYINGTPIFVIYSIILIFRVIYFGMLLNGSGKTKKIFLSSLISLITNITFLFVLKPFIGYYSAAISALISVIVMNTVQLYFSKSVLDIPFSKIMPWKNIFKIIIVNIMLGVLLYSVKLLLYIKFDINYFIIMIIIGGSWFVLFSLIYFKRFNQLKNNYIVDQ